jgi:hypothetical protein
MNGIASQTRRSLARALILWANPSFMISQRTYLAKRAIRVGRMRQDAELPMGDPKTVAGGPLVATR